MYLFSGKSFRVTFCCCLLITQSILFRERAWYTTPSKYGRHSFAFRPEGVYTILVGTPLSPRIETANFFKAIWIAKLELSNVGDRIIYSNHLTHQGALTSLTDFLLSIVMLHCSWACLNMCYQKRDRQKVAMKRLNFKFNHAGLFLLYVGFDWKITDVEFRRAQFSKEVTEAKPILLVAALLLMFNLTPARQPRSRY